MIVPTLLTPMSRGQVLLSSANPSAKPVIDPNYFSHPDDMRRMILGVRESMRLSRTRAMEKYDAKLPDNPIPGCEQFEKDSDEFWDCTIRTFADTLYHPSGTCKMGARNDSSAVVDPWLRVSEKSNVPFLWCCCHAFWLWKLFFRSLGWRGCELQMLLLSQLSSMDILTHRPWWSARSLPTWLKRIRDTWNKTEKLKISFSVFFIFDLINYVWWIKKINVFSLTFIAFSQHWKLRYIEKKIIKRYEYISPKSELWHYYFYITRENIQAAYRGLYGFTKKIWILSIIFWHTMGETLFRTIKNRASHILCQNSTFRF